MKLIFVPRGFAHKLPEDLPTTVRSAKVARLRKASAGGADKLGALSNRVCTGRWR